MPGIQAVVFDLYGTLISIDQMKHPYTKLFADIDVRADGEFKRARRIALTEDFGDLAAFVERIRPGTTIDLSPYERIIAEEKASTTLYSETKGVLDELRKRGLRLGLISNLSSPYKSSFFELGLQEYFSEIVFSCEAGGRKPEPMIYRLMLDRLDLDPARVLMTGDKVPADVEGPRAAGMQAVHLDRKHGSPGSISTLEGIFRYL